jgi:hypothetical protein
MGEAWQFTVLIGDNNGHFVGTPGRHAMNAAEVGHFTLPNRSEVWVVRHRIQLTGTVWKKNVEQTAQTLVARLDKRESPGVYRAHLIGQEDGLRYFAEVAVTFGGDGDAFQV